MIDQISTLRTFIRVARTGNFSRVAQELNLSQPTVSRTIADLEKSLGVTLFARTTRAVTLTEAGADYLIKVQAVLDALDEANHAVRGDEILRGVLRVGVSSIFASRVLVHRLAGFMDAHPALRIELLVDDKRQDLTADGIDVALRFGALADSSAVARKIGQWPLMIAASPAYLARHGTPATPADLADHVAIIAGPRRRQGLDVRRAGRRGDDQAGRPPVDRGGGGRRRGGPGRPGDRGGQLHFAEAGTGDRRAGPAAAGLEPGHAGLLRRVPGRPSRQALGQGVRRFPAARAARLLTPPQAAESSISAPGIAPAVPR
jgi:DNA-binding transcriptional LysR family regulator